MVGRGRKKTKMMLIEGTKPRKVCLCKRRTGLFKKARELSVLCGAKVGVLVFSTSGKPRTFDAPTLETLIARQLRQGSSEDMPRVESETPPTAAGEDKGEATLLGSLGDKMAPFWWERPDVASMSLDELRTFASALSAAREERLKQLSDHALDAEGETTDSNVFPSHEPSAIQGENGVATDGFVGEQPNDGYDEQYSWNVAAGQTMNESFFMPPSTGTLMDETLFLPGFCPPLTDMEGPQLPISLEDEPSRIDGRQAVAPNLLPCKPSVDATTASFQPLTWTDLFVQNQWI